MARNDEVDAINGTEDDGASELVKELQKLTRDLGVHRRRLYHYLGPNLRRAWGITATMRQEEVTRKAVKELSQLIGKLNGQDERIIRVYFNMINDPRIDGDKQIKLREMKQDARLADFNKEDKEHPLFIAKATAGRRRTEIFQQFAEEISDRLRALDAAGPAAPAKPTHLKAILIAVSITAIIGLSLVGYVVTRPSPPAVASSSASLSDPPKLIATLGLLTDASESWDVAFPISDLSQAKQFLDTTSDPLSVAPGLEGPPFVLDELNHGGYFLDGTIVDINLDTTSTNELTVTDVIPVNVVRQPTVVGAVVYVGSQGDNTFQMEINMLDPYPIDRVPDLYGQNGGHAGLFFDTSHVGVSATDSQALAVEFDDEYDAFTFDIRIDYKVGTSKYSLVLTRNGQPFRTTASTCPLPGLVFEDTPAELHQLESLRYQFVTAREEGTNPAMQIIDPNSPDQTQCSDQ
jgi:hypothetical protein